jgi:molybdopterin/thiamine biosynthesis adenylyltransferase
MDLIPIEVLNESITVVGAGAIGSFLVLSLAKMGFSNITVFDDDKIEVENLNCQFYRHTDIGKEKVVALAELVHDFTGVRIEAIAKRYEGGIFSGIVVSAVDSMAARKLVWANHAGLAPMTKAIIDPRMGAEQAALYVVKPMSEADAKTYAASLYDDKDAVQERCTAKATMYTATMLSGFVAKAIKDLVTNNKYPRTTLWSIAADEFVSWKG